MSTETETDTDLGEKEAQSVNTAQGQKELNEKVAKLCGWEAVGIPIPCGWYREVNGKGEAAFNDELPDYCNDLNACAEFEKGLTQEQRFVYFEHLQDAGGFSLREGTDEASIVTTKARQRCSAVANTTF